MSKTRRNHGSAFKAKVALEALKGEQTVAEIASMHGLHPTLVNEWKRQLADGASAVFEKGAGKAEKDGEASPRALQANRPAESGTFGTQALSRAERHPMIDRLNKHLSLTRQCQLLRLSRSSVYHQPAIDNTETRIRGFSGCGFETIAGLKVELGLERVDLVGGDGRDDVNEGVDDGSMLGQIEG